MSSATAAPTPAGTSTDHGDAALARLTMRQASMRLLPLLVLLFICNYLDRTNVAIAALQMNRDLHFSATAYGLGAGIFFLGYALFEVPSNLVLARVGARRWIGRIMLSWGLVASAMMFVRTPAQFYTLRVLLGIAEAGFFPGIVYYLSDWFPAAYRGRVLSRFLTALPLAGVIGNPLSGWLLGLDGRRGLAGWQWLFLLEGLPSVLLGIVVMVILPDKPADARWLGAEQRRWLTARLERDAAESRAPHGVPPLRALLLPVVWLVAMGSFLANTTSYGYLFWAPTLIRDQLHLTNAATGIVTGGIALVAMGVMVLVGAHSDRTGERNVHAAACMALAALGCVGTALLPSAGARMASLALVQIGVYAFYGPFWCLPPSLLRGTAAAAGIALVNSVGNLGGFTGPYVLGALKDATGGISGAFLVLALVATSGAALCLALRPRNLIAVANVTR